MIMSYIDIGLLILCGLFIIGIVLQGFRSKHRVERLDLQLAERRALGELLTSDIEVAMRMDKEMKK